MSSLELLTRLANMSDAEKLHEACRVMRIQQQHLAVELGMSPEHVLRMVNGHRDVPQVVVMATMWLLYVRGHLLD